MQITPESQAYPTFKAAFWYWLKLGFMSFGGPAGQIAMMHHDLVEQKRWISNKRFLHALNFCMVLPGPEAQQLAIYLGWLLHRTKGGIVAGLLFIAPSFLILVALAFIYLQYGTQPIIASIFYAIKPAVVAIVFFAAWRIGKRALSHPVLWLIAGSAFVAIAFFKVAFPWVMLTVAMLSMILGRLSPQLFTHITASHLPKITSTSISQPAMHALKHQNTITKPSYIIDDETPLPQYARFSRSHFVLILTIGLGLWLIALIWLMLLYGWAGAFTQMAWFFTKAALLTFGGAYAVLPYVYQGAVDYYHWLTPLQMMDGLALGESTPGPLIMVVTFVGFVSGWGQAIIGVDSPFALGLLAASIVTFFTFLPSFMLILLSAPFIEKTQNNIYFSAPLTAITAAVVGIILSLALFFALHIFLPFGFAIDTLMLDIDWLAVFLTLIGLIALLKYNLNIIYLLLCYMLIGLVKYWL
jgi:chromate transporter